jgi:predicted transcriptional regulator
MSLTPEVSRRERQILDIVYAHGEASATTVLAEIPDPPTRVTVRILLRILEQKGHLRHRKQGREYIYQPTRSRKTAGLSALRRVLRTFFDGSLERAVAAQLADRRSELSPEELKRMAELIARARKEY